MEKCGFTDTRHMTFKWRLESKSTPRFQYSRLLRVEVFDN